MVERGSPSGHLNKRTPRGSLWLPSLETVQVCHVDLQHSQFFLFLIRIDEELAAQAQGAGCSCGGVLHRANYPRKPRGCPSAALRDAFSSRLSFCCSRCRRRTTSMSVRFLGRCVYLGLVVVRRQARIVGPVAMASTCSRSFSLSLFARALLPGDARTRSTRDVSAVEGRADRRWRVRRAEPRIRTGLHRCLCRLGALPPEVGCLPGATLARRCRIRPRRCRCT